MAHTKRSTPYDCLFGKKIHGPQNRQIIMFLWIDPFSLECAITIELIGWQHIIRRGQEFHLLPLGTISRGNKPRKIGDLLPITYLRNSAHKTNTGQFLYWNERKNKILWNAIIKKMHVLKFRFVLYSEALKWSSSYFY